jgi:hypothetical protein
VDEVGRDAHEDTVHLDLGGGGVHPPAEHGHLAVYGDPTLVDQVLTDPPTAEPGPDIVAGSTLAVPMMTGDVTVAGMGTVTYRQGNKLVAFGHPMFSDGEADIPMAKGYIFGYMQSYSRSFKLGEAREIIGTIRQDRQFAIGGVFGQAPDRVVYFDGGAWADHLLPLTEFRSNVRWENINATDEGIILTGFETQDDGGNTAVVNTYRRFGK